MKKEIIKVLVGKPKEEKYGNASCIRILEKESLRVDGAKIDDLIMRLSELKNEYGNEYSNLYFDMVDDCSCYDSHCSCTPNIYLKGERLESDVEFNLRVKTKANLEAEREARERAEYEKLKAKFGD